MSRIQVIVGGQAGSEGKGAVAGHLAQEETEMWAVRVGGPNAGHTVIDAAGRRWSLQQVPVAAVTNSRAQLLIGAGSEIDPLLLEREVNELDGKGFNVSARLLVDPEATVVQREHALAETGGLDHGEAGITRLVGSTGKGVGAARADRIWRRGQRWGDLDAVARGGLATSNTAAVLRAALRREGTLVQVEGTQGYVLGLHAGYYPYCTSRDCRAIDFLAEAGISPWVSGAEVTVWVVCRTYPIRVAGNSGPMENETTWEALATESGGHIQAERTTVTKKIRRVSEWNWDWVLQAVRENGGGPQGRVQIALTFADYLAPAAANRTDFAVMEEECTVGPWKGLQLGEVVRLIESQTGSPVGLVTTGPSSVVGLAKSAVRA